MNNHLLKTLVEMASKNYSKNNRLKFESNVWVKFIDDNQFECIGRTLVIGCVKYISYIDCFGNSKMIEFDELKATNMVRLAFKKSDNVLINELSIYKQYTATC